MDFITLVFSLGVDGQGLGIFLARQKQRRMASEDENVSFYRPNDQRYDFTHDVAGMYERH